MLVRKESRSLEKAREERKAGTMMVRIFVLQHIRPVGRAMSQPAMSRTARRREMTLP
jgi:hypothetical protein